MKVRRRPAQDVLVRGGEMGILVDGIAIRLSELAAMVFTLTEEPVDVVTLADELERRFGTPVGSSLRQATELVVADLVREGVLVASV